MSKYYKNITTTVKAHNQTYWISDGKGGKRPVTRRKKPYPRNVKVRDHTYYNRVIKTQISKDDWSHLSEMYSNIIGLSDEEIENFIKNTSENKEKIREYIKHIRCYNQDDIREISKKMYKDFEAIMNKKAQEGKLTKENPYNEDTTIFITSPRGGFDILSDFGYANELNKRQFPYDLERYESGYSQTLRSESLPYGSGINDVNDIVFIDDIYMSGEQCGKAYYELDKKLRELNISNDQKPRIHYMSIAGNEHASQGKAGWDTFIVGEKFNFRRKGNQFEGISAVVFPFSIPDGEKHHTARRLYREKKRFEHRKY